jgi:hypothetical protein
MGHRIQRPRQPVIESTIHRAPAAGFESRIDRSGASALAGIRLRRTRRHLPRNSSNDIVHDIVFVVAIPHSATGKVLKTKLREDFRNRKLPSA